MSCNPYPILRIARKHNAIQGIVGEYFLRPTRARRISTSNPFQAANRNRIGSSSDKGTISASSQVSPKSSSSTSTKGISQAILNASETSAAGRAYTASVRKASPVAESSQGPKAKEGKKKEDDKARPSSMQTDGQLEGGAQKMYRKETISPDIQKESGQGQKPISIDQRDDAPLRDGQDKVAEGVIISSNGQSIREDSSKNLFPPSSGSSINERESSNQSQQRGERGDGGPPAVTEKISSESNENQPRHLFRYPFNTHAFIKRLQEAEFIVSNRLDSKTSSSSDPSMTALSANKRHDPAEAIMEALHLSLTTRGQEVIDSHMNKTEAENQAYLFSAALAELRTELQVRARNDAAALRSMVTLLQREVDSLNQRMREDVASMKHDIQVDMNNRKSEAKEEQNTLDQEIQDLNNRFTISISDLKTEIEQSIKWDATRRALTIFFGCIVILIATLAAADYLTRDDVEANSTNGKHGQNEKGQSEIKPKTPEELGLIARDDEHGNRFV